MIVVLVIVGLFLTVAGFTFVFPVEVTSQIGNTFTVSLFASFLKINMQPDPSAWAIFVIGFAILLFGFFQEEMKSYKLPCGCVLKTNNPERAIKQKCRHGNQYAKETKFTCPVFPPAGY